MSQSDRPVRRRQFLIGMGGAAAALSPLGLPAVSATAATSPFPPFPSADVTTTQDREQMLWQLGVPAPDVPARLDDPNAPANAQPRDSTNPDGNWTDPLGHTVQRSAFGQWITYDDDAGLAGGAASPKGAYGPYSHPRYPDIPLLRCDDGTTVRTPEDWWLKRRPEIAAAVRDNLYGHIPDPAHWPQITWSVGAATTGTDSGVSYQDRVITGTIDTSGYPTVRNAPVIQGTLRTPLDKAGQPVPVIITFGTSTSAWAFTASYGYGIFAYNSAVLQPDSGGANLSSYLIGLINKGDWRKPGDWGALAAWGWGISRLIDFFETFPDVDGTKIGVQGHSRYGKATLVAAAYDDRIVAAFPSCGGALGTSWARRTWGENLEFVSGSDSEYHWVAGNTMRYMGELHPGHYWPRKVADLPVDVHSVMSLLAPRVVLTNGGTDTPPGFGDAWQDPRGMYLAGKVASPVWELLGWRGQVIPDDVEFTSGPGEAVGGTPPIDVAFIDGNVGWRRHKEGHTPSPDRPSFVLQASRFFDNARPVVAPGQRFTAEQRQGAVVGTIRASDADGDGLGNWQITGGTGAYTFAVDRDTGRVTVADQRALTRSRYTLSVIVDDGKLPSRVEVVTIDVR